MFIGRVRLRMVLTLDMDNPFDCKSMLKIGSASIRPGAIGCAEAVAGAERSIDRR